MQFVQIKPCNLYQTAQEQLKKAEEVKKIKEIKKEEPEDWQNVSRHYHKLQLDKLSLDYMYCNAAKTKIKW